MLISHGWSLEQPLDALGLGRNNIVPLQGRGATQETGFNSDISRFAARREVPRLFDAEIQAGIARFGSCRSWSTAHAAGLSYSGNGVMSYFETRTSLYHVTMMFIFLLAADVMYGPW